MTTAEATPLPASARSRSTGLTRGLGGLTRAEARRWLPWRTAGFIVLGLGLLAALYANWLIQPAKTLTELLYPFFGLWFALLILATVAMTQGMVASEISQGTAAWVVSKPVARPAFILSKFAALVPIVVVAMVGIPGLAARWVFSIAESEGQTEFNAGDLVRLLEEPLARNDYMPLMDFDVHLGILALMIFLILVAAAAMVLLGCLLRHATAILVAGLMVPIALVVLANVGLDQQVVSLTPAWAMDSMLDGIAGNPVSVLGPSIVATLWTVGLLGLASWWFNRREL